jgi:hypothetical protein|tara:strand:- start:475 stop:678 length:204 start_codon:yes stop_codon:yes gene_type:complete
MNDWLSIVYHALQDFYYYLLNQNIIQLPAKFSTKKSQPLKTMIGFSLLLLCLVGTAGFEPATTTPPV